MFRKIVYIVLFCLCLLQTKAQNTADSSPHNSLPKSSPDSTSGHKPPENTDGTKTANNNNKDNPQSSSLSIKITDKQSPRKSIDANVKIVDLANNETLHPAKNGNSYLLSLNHKYSINITAKNYDPFNTVYTAQKNKFTLPVQLQRINLPDNVPSSTKVLPNDSTKVVVNDSTKVTTNDLTKVASNDSTRLTPNDSTNVAPNDAMLNTILLIAISVIFIITSAVFILSVKTRRDLRLANAKISDLTDQIKSNQQMMKENNDNMSIHQPADETAATTPVSIIPQANETPSTTQQNDPVINKPDANAYFVCELMITAGPRKDDFEDVDLGEDVCGCISNSNEAIVWVLDGTSDADRKARVNNLAADDENPTPDGKSLVYFSSRLLAQSIGNKIKKSFTKNTAESLKEIAKKIITEVKEDWQKTFDELPADDKKELEETVKHKSVIQCSTTVLIARLSINGELTAYRVGDSKMLVFENTANGIRLVETELQEKSDEKNDRVFFSLQLNKSDQRIRFVSNIDEDEKPKKEEERPKYQTASEKNISTIISFSDGVGMKTQTYLKEEYKNNPESVRKEIMYQNQATEDDKSICFIEIKQPG